ncbi:MAG: 30S ribosomal protein S16 [Saprospiraceae bacterium]|nr:30S ribosomal protein S16 [Saprospiraceae bacterium]
MAVKMRLSRKGRKKAPFYHIIIADARSPRDGKFIEKIGTYNPMTKPATIEIDRMAAFDWLSKGAQPTDTVKAILRFKGVYYRKHLMRGVKKGAMSLEQADVLWQKWIDDKESKIASRRAETIAEMEAFRKLVSGEAKVKAVVADESTKKAAEAYSEVSHEEHADAPAASEVVDAVETVVADEAAAIEEAPVIEAKVEEVVAEADSPAADETTPAVEESADEATETPAE